VVVFLTEVLFDLLLLHVAPQVDWCASLPLSFLVGVESGGGVSH
jgi:hypothetical protein